MKDTELYDYVVGVVRDDLSHGQYDHALKAAEIMKFVAEAIGASSGPAEIEKMKAVMKLDRQITSAISSQRMFESNGSLD